MLQLKEQNGKYYNKCGVVMLYAKTSCIHLQDSKIFMTREDNGFIPYSYAQHLYISSDEEIKELP